MNATITKDSKKPAQRVEEFVAPDVNIIETTDGYLLEAEMPGVTKEGLEITLEGAEITITGHRAILATPGKTLLRERNPADFRRTFELDPAIDTSRIAAKMNQGVVTVTLPKSARAKPQKIAVTD